MATLAGVLVAAAAVLATLFLFLVLFLKKRYRYWVERRVPGPPPALFFGHVKDSVTVKITEAQVVENIVNKYKAEKVVGIFNLWKPIILVKDYELAKRIMEKDSEYFIDHPPILSEELTDYAFYSIFTMMGEPWKSRRQVLSKLFTPKKLKEYLEDMRPGLRTLVGKLDGDVETDLALTAFTAQTTAQVLYGLDLSNDPVRTEELVRIVSYFIHPPISTVIKVISYSIWPGFFRFFRMGVMPVEVWNYASQLYDSLVEARAHLDVERDDGLTLITKMATEGTSSFGKIERKEAVGHTFQFLIGGVHTTATVMSHIFLRLAQHPDVQEKARQEVVEVLNGAKTVTYEHIAQMKYLDNIIIESMRLVSLTGILKRTCTKECELVEGLRVPLGMDLWIDISGIQRDPAFFPEPDKFIPERWSTPGQADPGAFMTFGRGPRICIGKRMAEMQIKLMLSTVLPKFDILPSEKNKDPWRFNPNTIIITSVIQGGAWVKFKPRS